MHYCSRSWNEAQTDAVIDDDSDKEMSSFWLLIELIALQALFVGFTFVLVVLLGAIVIDKFARCRKIVVI